MVKITLWTHSEEILRNLIRCAALAGMSLLVPAVLAGAATAPVPPQDDAQARVGLWRPPAFNTGNGASWGLTPTQIATIRDKLRQISDVIREASVLKMPVGFEGRLLHGMYPADGGVGKTFSTGNPPTSGITLQIFPYARTCATCPIEPAAESPAFIRLTVNSIDGFYDLWQQPFARDREGAMYLAPLSIGSWRGFPMYQAPGHAPQVLLTRSTTPPIWVPVTQERFIRHRIETERRTIARVKPPGDQAARRALAELEVELAGLTAAERAAPAYYTSDRSARRSGLGARGGRELVSTNPAFFDLKRPKTDFQVAVVETYAPDILLRKPRYFAGEKVLEAMETIDWEKIAALIR